MVNYILENVDKTLSEEPNNAGYTPLQLAGARHLTNSNNKLIIKELLRFNPKGMLEKESSTDEDDEDSEQPEAPLTPTSSSSTESMLLSMNLTCDRGEVVRILEEHSGPGEETTELTPLKNVPYNLTVEETVEEHPFDEECFSQLCELLNRDQTWKEVGALLDFNAFFSMWEQSANPTGMLLNCFEMQKMKLNHLIEILQALDQKDAIHLIDEMVCRKLK
ncbi:uncharacterized protein LOC129723313 [Wyeomyia smithii]|nr:uncharacterized protein LOC129723313 [Wyeomyia smithii]